MYRSFPAYLWVEDEETRAYLETAWNGESLIAIYVAGGHQNIVAAVKAARLAGFTHVFGFRDRDFEASNRARWDDTSVHVLRGDAHELENLLLDREAIAACDVNTSGMNAAQIAKELLALAAPLTWWMSCRRTITELHDAVNAGFLEHPSPANVKSLQEAENAIIQSRWWKDVLPTLHGTWGNRGTITTNLAQYEASYRAMLTSDAWQQEFSGKEILRALMTKIWTQNRPSDPAGRITFVQEIAKAQLALKRVPLEIGELRTAIRRRIGR